jgi:site-specific DNA-methyltransferase (adenine-specific)
MELARGASNVALQMLLRTKNADAWSQATNFHSTVKPISLMRYLVRLTKTPTGGVVLDPFMGSGTTGCACALEGRDFIGIEREQDYFAIAEKRIAEAQKQPKLELE